MNEEDVMWSHYCKVEKHSMYVEDAKECNRCGETEPVNQGEDMKEECPSNINDVVDHEDGSATITMDLDEETQGILIKQGLQYLIDEMKVTDNIKVLDANEFSEGTKTHNLTDDEANALFHFGFLYAIKAGMKGLENEL